jgi:Fe-S-cluster containining protein
MKEFRECGECTACCTWLKGDAYGHEFGEGKSCRFVCKTGCSVHKARPAVCKKYFCAWAQNLLSEEMRPDQCGVLASVENAENSQYLKLTFIDEKINTNMLEYFKEWSLKMNAPVVYFKNKNIQVL